MSQLAVGVNATETLWTVDAVPDPEFGFYTVGSEIIQVIAGFPGSDPGYAVGQTFPSKIRVIRATNDTTAASHLAGVALAAVTASGGAGGIDVTDGTTTVSGATSLSLPKSTVTDEGGGVAESIANAVVLQTTGATDADVSLTAIAVDGAANAYHEATTSGSGPANADSYATANGGGDASASSTAAAVASGSAIASAVATAVNNQADARPRATTSGSGDASAGPRAIATGSGDADAQSVVAAVGGIANVGGNATTTSGSAGAVLASSTTTGDATSEVRATRSAVTMGLTVVVDGTSGRLGFNDATPIAKPIVPLTAPDAQDVIDALVALGLISQSD